MPENLTPVSQWVGVAVPLPNEPRTAASVRTPFQAITDCLKYLKDIVDGGVTRIRPLTSTADLKAVTGMTSGSVRVLQNSNFPRLWIFRAGLYPGADITNQLYRANDASGAWVSESFFLDGGDLALANLTLTGVFAGKGRFRRRVLTMGNANVTVSVADYDMVYLPGGVQTTERTIELTNDGAVEGDVFRVFTQDAVRYVNMTTTVGTVNFPVKVSLTNPFSAELTFIGGFWRVSARGDQIDP